MFCVTLVNLAIKALTTYAIVRFSLMRAFSISTTLLQGYLFQPYVWFLGRNTSGLSKTVLSEVDIVVRQTILPAMKLMATLATVLFVAGLLIVMQPAAALGAVVLIGGSYMIIYLGVRKILTRLGEQRVTANTARFKVAQEATGGIKDVKILGLEAELQGRFRRWARRMARVQTKSAVISQMPRFGLEIVAFGGMLLLILVMLIRGDGEVGAVLPVLGLFAVAGARLFPALQGLFSTITSLRTGEAALTALVDDLSLIHI